MVFSPRPCKHTVYVLSGPLLAYRIAPLCKAVSQIQSRNTIPTLTHCVCDSRVSLTPLSQYCTSSAGVLYRMGTPLARPCSSLRLLPGRNTCAPWCSYVSSCRQDTTGAGAKINTFHTYFLSGAAMRPDFWSRCCLNMPDIGRDCRACFYGCRWGASHVLHPSTSPNAHTHVYQLDWLVLVLLPYDHSQHMYAPVPHPPHQVPVLHGQRPHLRRIRKLHVGHLPAAAAAQRTNYRLGWPLKPVHPETSTPNSCPTRHSTAQHPVKQRTTAHHGATAYYSTTASPVQQQVLCFIIAVAVSHPTLTPPLLPSIAVCDSPRGL